MTAPVMTLAQFAHTHSLTTTADVQGHIHAGLRSMPVTKSYRRNYGRILTRLQDARDATTTAYRDAVDRGEIREPSRLARLLGKARGHSDNRSVQAARRILMKRAGLGQ